MDQLRYVYKPKRKYSSYNKDKKLVSQMLDFFKNNDKESYILADVSKKVNVPIYILSNWRKKLEEDPSYVPGARIGQHKRLFTTAQELTVADFIRVQFINPGVMLRRKHLRNVLFTLWQSLDLEHRANVPKKFVSRHFLKDFSSMYLRAAPMASNESIARTLSYNFLHLRGFRRLYKRV